MNRIRKSLSQKVKSIFTKREWEVFGLLELGHTSQEIADKLYRSRYTIDNHRGNMLERTGAKNTTELIAIVRGRKK